MRAERLSGLVEALGRDDDEIIAKAIKDLVEQAVYYENVEREYRHSIHQLQEQLSRYGSRIRKLERVLKILAPKDEDVALALEEVEFEEKEAPESESESYLDRPRPILAMTSAQPTTSSFADRGW